MASKWHQMTDEEKKAHMEKAKEYRYARKAKALGITVEEYKERLNERAAGKKVKLKSGRKKLNPAYRASLDNILEKDYRINKRGLKKNKGQIDQGVTVNRGDGSMTVMFRKGNLVLASLYKEPLNNGEDREKGVVAPVFFIDTESGKMKRLNRETDVKKGRKVQGPEDIKWPKTV